MTQGNNEESCLQCESGSLNGVSSGKSGGWATALSKGLPGFLFAQFGDVRCVVAAVPGVEEEQPVHCVWAVFRMDKHAEELIRSERAPESNPTVMQRIQKCE